jgi:hypothetical protein
VRTIVTDEIQGIVEDGEGMMPEVRGDEQIVYAHASRGYVCGGHVIDQSPHVVRSFVEWQVVTS